MKIVLSCLVFVVSVGSSVLADIQQTQNTMMGLGSEILLLQGNQAADAIQNLAVYNEQGAASAGNQSFTGNLTEIGHASSDGAMIGVQQNLATAGLQTQDLSNLGELQLEGQTFLFRAQEGPSIADALHQILLVQGPAAYGAVTGMDASGVILGLQSSSMGSATLPMSITQSEMLVSASRLLEIP